MDVRLLDPPGEVEEQLDDVRVQAEVGSTGAVLDIESPERDGTAWPLARMPAQDRTRHLVVLVKPILGLKRVPFQTWGVSAVEIAGHDLGRVIAAKVPGGLPAQLLLLAALVLPQELRIRGMHVQATWIPVDGIVGT